MKRKCRKSVNAAKGFTLIELLLVITIISVLAAVVVPRFFGRSQEARIVAARQSIVGTFGIAMDMFEQDTGRYPRSDEGLRALVNNPQINGPRNTEPIAPHEMASTATIVAGLK